MPSLSSVYSQNSEGAEQKGPCLREMPLESWEISPLAPRKAGVNWPRHLEHTISCVWRGTDQRFALCVAPFLGLELGCTRTLVWASSQLTEDHSFLLSWRHWSDWMLLLSCGSRTTFSTPADNVFYASRQPFEDILSRIQNVCLKNGSRRRKLKVNGEEKFSQVIQPQVP